MSEPVSGHRHVLAQVDILNRMEEFDALFHGLLKCLATCYQAHSSGPLVNHRRLDHLGQIVLAGGASGIDQSDPSHVVVHHLIPRQVNRMFPIELRVHLLVELAKTSLLVQGLIAAISHGRLLLNNIGLNRRAEVVGLSRHVGAQVVIHAPDFEGLVPQIAPENRHHPRLVRPMKDLADFLDLPAALSRAEVHRRSDRHGAHIKSLPHVGKQDLIERVGMAQQFVVIELDDEGYLVRVPPCNASEHAQRRCHGVAARFKGQFHDVLAVEVNGIRGKRRPGGMLDPLIYGQNRKITRTVQVTIIYRATYPRSYPRP